MVSQLHLFDGRNLAQAAEGHGYLEFTPLQVMKTIFTSGNEDCSDYQGTSNSALQVEMKTAMTRPGKEQLKSNSALQVDMKSNSALQVEMKTVLTLPGNE